MSEDFVPAAQDRLADERPYLELHLIACRECGYSTGTPNTAAGSVYDAHYIHYEQTRHTRFWKYTISRSNGCIGTIKELTQQPDQDT